MSVVCSETVSDKSESCNDNQVQSLFYKDWFKFFSGRLPVSSVSVSWDLILSDSTFCIVLVSSPYRL